MQNFLVYKSTFGSSIYLPIIKQGLSQQDEHNATPQRLYISYNVLKANQTITLTPNGFLCSTGAH
jgi:hypothetical protein